MKRFLAALGLVLLPLSVHAQDWAGQWVFPRTEDVALRDGERKVVGKWSVGAGKVLRSDGEWLEVRHSSYPGPLQGWVKKEEVVKLADAPDFFSEKIRANPNDLFAYRCRGIAYREKGDYAKALKDFDEVIKLDPKDWPTWCSRGNLRYVQKDYDGAIKDYDQALSINPKDVTTIRNRALARDEKGDHDGAIKDYDEAIKLDPRASDAIRDRGIAWRRKGDKDRAIKDFDDSIRLDPNDPLAYSNRAFTYRLKGEYGKAIKDFDAVIRLEPKDVYALNNLAWLLATSPDEKDRDGKRAVELATRACEVTAWKASEDLETLAAAYAEVGNFDKAIEFQKKVLADDEYMKRNGAAAKDRMQLYERKQPIRMSPPK
jgi:tetratricopeptide (TPR) repeat protein